MKHKFCTLALLFSGITSSLYVHAYETGDWIVRAGFTVVSPDDSSNNVFVGGGDLGLGVNVGSSTQLGLNIGYFLSPRLTLEILLATPFKHDINLDTVGSLGSAKQLPPTVSVNYYFAEPTASFQPYVGAGINYTVFFDERFTDENKRVGFSDLSLDDSVGLSLQTGLDYMLDEKWHINASVRWIDIDTDAEFTLNDMQGNVSVDVDPFVYTLAFGYRF